VIFREALKMRIADIENKIFTDTEYENFIALAGGTATDTYDGSDNAHVKYLELAEKECLQAILNNPVNTKFNTFREGAYGKTLDTEGIRKRIERIEKKYHTTGMKSI
jgi:hypothetical protein